MSVIFVYENMEGQAVQTTIDLSSDQWELNPYVNRDRLTKAIASHRALMAEGNTPNAIKVFEAALAGFRNQLAECQLLIEQWEMAQGQKDTVSMDARTASTEEEREVITTRARCDDTTKAGTPCRNYAMEGDTKCGPHRDKANKLDAQFLQLPFDDKKEKGMKQATGNLWTFPAEVRVITTNGTVKNNGAAVMGRGCAKEAKDKFPGIDRRLGQLLTQYGNRCFRLTAELVSFPVKHQWHEQASLELIAKSCGELLEMADKFGWTNVVLPRPGCGNGRLSWEEVAPVVAILDDRFTVITF